MARETSDERRVTASDLAEVIEAVKGQVAFHQWLGVKGYPAERLYDAEMGPQGKLDKIREELGDCRRCRLWEKRTNLVFGEGDPKADLVFIGEGPGRDEDIEGRPFVGAAGRQLTDIITKGMNLSREDVYICNVVKCRPPDNRDPLPDEISACEPFLIKQLRAIRPRVMVALGRVAAQNLLKTDVPISRLRGKFHDYDGIPLMPTFHPAYLLRNPGGKKPVWEDIKKVMKLLDLK